MGFRVFSRKFWKQLSGDWWVKTFPRSNYHQIYELMPQLQFFDRPYESSVLYTEEVGLTEEPNESDRYLRARLPNLSAPRQLDICLAVGVRCPSSYHVFFCEISQYSERIVSETRDTHGRYLHQFPFNHTSIFDEFEVRTF